MSHLCWARSLSSRSFKSLGPKRSENSFNFRTEHFALVEDGDPFASFHPLFNYLMSLRYIAVYFAFFPFVFVY